MMKICLINPPQILQKQFGRPYIFQPLGLLYIAAVLDKDYSVQIIDAPVENWDNLREINGSYFLGLSFKDIEEKIRKIKPDIVGITIPFSVNAESAFKIASIAKKVDKKIITIMGGSHITVRPVDALSLPYVDFVIVGEGEETIQELMEKIDKKLFNELSEVRGIGYKKNGKPVITLRRPLIQNLDSLPFPARHLIPMKKYFSSMASGRGARSIYTFNERWTSVYTSRGCPYRCNFCTINLTMGRQFRPRSPENVLVEIKQIYKDYGIRHINFEDDNMTLDKKRAERIFDLIIENKLDITWSTPNGVRVENIDEGLVKKMKKSGCRRVFVAPESGSQRVVSKIISKSLDLKKIEKTIVLFKKYRIIVDGSFVMGLIGETKRDIWKTIFFALKLKRLGMDTAGIHIATPYYGTRLYDEAKEKGYLRADLNPALLSPKEALISTPEWNTVELRRLHKIANWLVNYSLKGKIISILPIPCRVSLVWLKKKYYKIINII